MNLRRRLLRVNHIVTLNGTHTADDLGLRFLGGFVSDLIFNGITADRLGLLTGVLGLWRRFLGFLGFFGASSATSSATASASPAASTAAS